jgi:hypothetical protein
MTMETRAVTIEISREVAVLLLWIAAGVVVIGATFLVAFDPQDHWATVNATGLASALYIGAFVGYILRPPIPVRARAIGLVVLAVFVGTFTYGWRSIEDTSSWQRWLLLEIRSKVGRGSLQNDVPPLLESVQLKQIQGSSNPRIPIGRIFRDMNPHASPGKSMLEPRWQGDSLQIIVTELSDTAIALTGVDRASGWDPDFRNVNGRTGSIQVWYRLTDRGIEYGTDN